MTLEQLIREDLERVSNDVPVARGALVEELMARARRRTRVKRVSVVGLAAIVFVGVLALNPFPETPLDVAGTEAENVLRTDPLIIRGQPGPEPLFDTRSLGENRDLTPVVDLDDYITRVRPSRGFFIDLIESFTSPSHAGFDQMSTVGYTPDGVAVAITHATTWSPTDGTTHWVCVSDEGGSGCGGDREQAPEFPAWSGSAGMTVGGPGVLSFGVLPETSVAMLTVNGERFWQRPIAGLAVFDTDLRGGDRLTYTLFDDAGRIVAVSHEFPSGDRETVAACPVTYPDGRFQAPDPYPTEPVHVGMVWHGSEALWTALPVDGQSVERKTVFWSASFPGGTDGAEPELEVTYRRLDAETPPESNEGRATGGHTPEDGWFMIGGIDPGDPGCWEVTATYKGTTLSYVYEVREP